MNLTKSALKSLKAWNIRVIKPEREKKTIYKVMSFKYVEIGLLKT